MISKQPDKPYQDTLAIQTSKVSLSNSNDYNRYVSIGKNSSRMRPVVWIVDAETRPDLIETHLLDRSWLGNIHQRDMLEILSASEMK